MKQKHSLLHQPAWRVIDHRRTGAAFDAIDSFAVDDTLCAAVGAGDSPSTARLWVHRDTVVLGIQDSRLPRVEAGVAYLRERGYRVIIRNSGGLGVPLDDGVLNVSLVLPVENVFSNIDLGYEAMATLVTKMLRPYTERVDVREIAGSYCSGRYDLSSGGKKFGGISQRRTKGGMAVQVFLNVTGSGHARGALMQAFYRLAASEGVMRRPFPTVRPETIASLSELLPAPITNGCLTERLLEVLREHTQHLLMTDLLPEEETVLAYNRQRMRRRNEQNLGLPRVRGNG